MRYQQRGRPGVSSIIGSIFFILIMLVAIASLATIFNSFSSYNGTLNKANNANVQASATKLSITGSAFGSFPPSTTSNFNVATACASTSTSPTNRPKLFDAAGMWWDFFTCNSNYQYSSSYDGVSWSAETTIPALVGGYAVGSDFDVEVVGTTVYLVIAKVGSPDFQLGIGTLAAGGTNASPGGTISWTEVPASVVTTANAHGPINMAVDGAGNQWVAVVQGTCTSTSNCAIGMYEHEACATASNEGWEPNACASATNPTNYAPTALGTLSANAHTIIFPAISAYSSTGAILMYETGSATSPSTGTLGVVTQTVLASSTWSTISLAGITDDYSLTSSSAVMMGGTFYFAGLASGSVGQTTGTLKFWTLSFASMTAAATSTPHTMEGSTAAWQAALTSSGSTLVLFDNPTASTIQYYSSSTLGTIWSAAIPFVSGAGDTAINGLCPSDDAFAVTWTGGSPYNVRFAALSTFTVANASPFSVHVVDLYVYDSSTNSLVAHYYLNSTEDFDYWIGQGATISIPVRFVWTASTSYLVTIGTDNGVTAQLLAGSLPVTSVSCPTGNFFSQISPTTLCGAPGSTGPYMISGAGANTCTDTTSGTALMMGLGLGYTTSAISSGNLYLSFSFQVSTTSNSGGTSTWELYYGTGTAPGCGDAATGTALGQPYTVKSQSSSARGLSQSLGVTLANLGPSTTYWFDVQATDSSGTAWVYSNPDLALIDLQTTGSPNLTTSTNTNTCTDTTSGTARMMGFRTSFTTGGAGFTGNVFGKLSFNVAGAASSGISTQYTVAYGTGTAPGCNAGAAGTTYGNTYTVTSQASVASGAGQKAGFVLTGLSPSTTYWVDLQAVDSNTAAWVYSNPTLAVMEMPASTSALPAVASDSNANTCTVTTANTYKMGGFGLVYNVPTSAVGDLYITLTFQVTTPGTNNVNTQWQATWQTGAPPLCNTLGTGTTVGNTYEVTSQSGTAGAFSQSETFVLQNVEKVAGAAIWVDVQAYDSSGASWRFSQAEISVAEFPA